MPQQRCFARDIRQARKALGITQEKTAELLHISTNEYKNLEAGRYWPKVPLFFRITRLFGLRPQEYEEEALQDDFVHSD